MDYGYGKKNAVDSHDLLEANHRYVNFRGSFI